MVLVVIAKPVATLTFHTNFGFAIETVEALSTVVDKGNAFEVEQVSVPVSKEMFWSLPIW